MDYFKKLDDDLNMEFYVSHEDYLKVVEEKEKLKECLQNLQMQDENKFHDLSKCEKKIKEKDEMIERKDGIIEMYVEKFDDMRIENYSIKKKLSECGVNNGYWINEVEKLNKENKKLKKENDFHNKEFKRLSKFISDNSIDNGRLLIVDSIITEVELLWEKLKEKDEIIKEKEVEIERKNKTISNLVKRLEGYEKEEESLYTLNYVYGVDGEKKLVRLDPQPLEEIHELVGMDCDNWVAWSIEKVVK